MDTSDAATNSQVSVNSLDSLSAFNVVDAHKKLDSLNTSKDCTDFCVELEDLIYNVNNDNSKELGLNEFRTKHDSEPLNELQLSRVTRKGKKAKTIVKEQDIVETKNSFETISPVEDPSDIDIEDCEDIIVDVTQSNNGKEPSATTHEPDPPSNDAAASVPTSSNVHR
ncbi:hypothetical protein TNIN_236261 [Trichonephila inaurata madagascariensis]|uniref:Uncharacterized protein n=1 Tax=Trichonephila inaurata madagascariensis TaxID=2747483 RepID=A0A8X6YRS8_9ARAC|nr:hypothetical protein TNIN_236261 [Trichonephila inaurata madagascariensis]